MTIKNDLSIEYRIPKDIKKKIPEYFYQAFFGELVSVYGYRCLVPLFEYGSYRKQIEDFLTNGGGTGVGTKHFDKLVLSLI